MNLPEGAPAPIMVRDNLATLPAFVLGRDLSGPPLED